MPSPYANRETPADLDDYIAHPITVKYIQRMPRVKGSRGWAINEIRHRLRYMKEMYDSGAIQHDRRNVAMGTIMHLLGQIDAAKAKQ